MKHAPSEIRREDRLDAVPVCVDHAPDFQSRARGLPGLAFDVKSRVAQQERIRISERTRAGLERRQEKVKSWRIEDTLRERGANYVQGGLFKAFVVRDGRLITGQQQYSGRKVAQAVIEALGV